MGFFPWWQEKRARNAGSKGKHDFSDMYLKVKKKQAGDIAACFYDND